MAVAESSVLTRLKISNRLPTPKGVALEVINLTQRENVSNQEIARLIGSDPALSARVIKAANVLLANPSRPIVSLADAVTVLGARALRQLVLGIALIVDYRHGPCEQFDYPYFWAHSLLTGIAARHLAQRARLAAAEEIFVLGLLGHIGQLALATVYPEEYGALLAQAQGKQLAEQHRMERDKFSCDRAELSEAILAELQFPKIFQMLVRDFPTPETSKAVEGSREWRLLHLLQLASLMADVSMSGSAGRGALLARLRSQAARAGVEEDFLVEVGDACVRDWGEWAALLNMGSRHIPPFAELLRHDDGVDAAVEVPQWPHAEEAQYKMRVLVVEDDRSMLALLEAMLRSAGHEVVIARNGAEALRLIGEARPQLVITDWAMPEMGGIELCRRLRESAERRNVYVTILTAQESVDKLVEAFEAGADDYLVKPLTPKIFFARLRAAQRVVQLQEELAFDREQLVRFSRELAASNERLQRLALTDALTELPNRRFAMERIEQEWALSLRGERALSCMMIDIDRFKAINDKFGHQTGDEALRFVAGILRQSARTQDVVCRYGGEEFVVICPDTDIESARQCAERLRANVAGLELKSPAGNIGLTVSIGVAEKRDDTGSIEKLLIRADGCLYAAKEAGRNLVIADK